jgi:hypothetical protein
MNLTHAYEEMAPERRPQDPHLDGIGPRFKTLDRGCEYPDTMPQAINAERRSWRCEACGGYFDIFDLGAALDHEERLLIR